MRFQGQLSGLLAASLLAMSSWASACDLSCSFERLHSGCPANSPTEDQQAGIMSAGMNMEQENPAAIAEAEEAPQTGMILLMDVSCTHELCGRPLVSASIVGTDHREFKNAHIPAVSAMQPHLRLLESSYHRTEASPPKIAAMSPISINLRI